MTDIHRGKYTCCTKCPTREKMDVAEFLEHYLRDHLKINPFACECGQTFSTLLYARLHKCDNRKLDFLLNFNTPGLDARLVALQLALNEGIEIVNAEISNLLRKQERSKMKDEMMMEVRKEIADEVRRDVTEQIRQEERKRLLREGALKVPESITSFYKQRGILGSSDQPQKSEMNQPQTAYGKHPAEPATDAPLEKRMCRDGSSSQLSEDRAKSMRKSTGFLLPGILRCKATCDSSPTPAASSAAALAKPTLSIPNKGLDDDEITLADEIEVPGTLYVSNDTEDTTITTITTVHGSNACGSRSGLAGRVTFPGRK